MIHSADTAGNQQFGFRFQFDKKSDHTCWALPSCWAITKQRGEWAVLLLYLHPDHCGALGKNLTPTLHRNVDKLNIRNIKFNSALVGHFCQTATSRFVGTCQYQTLPGQFSSYLTLGLGMDWRLLLFLIWKIPQLPSCRMSYFGAPWIWFSDLHQLFPYSAFIARISSLPLLAFDYIEISAWASLYQ